MAKARFSKEQYLKWYEEMLLWRRFEEKAGQLYIQQRIRGFCHLYIGQEAVVAGATSVIRHDDNMISAYRDHVHPIAKGVHPNAIMAELMAKITGCSKGKGGSMHMFSAEHRFFGGHGIVGGQIPLGAGIAFADKYNGSDRVTLCYMGDGAVRQGALHEAFNMAMLWKLPVIFIIENNNYAMGTSVERTTNVLELHKIGLSYEMPSKAVNGMNVEDVHDATEWAVNHARGGNGPVLLEVKTYRFRGHSMSDPGKYRTKEEVEQYKERDPVETSREKLLDYFKVPLADIEVIDERVRAEVEECVRFAEESPWPSDDELLKDVYVQQDYPFIMD